jgi:hypothetical protein
MRMRTAVLILLASSWAALIHAAETAGTTPAAQQAIAKATGAALQADVRQALAELRAVDAGQFSGVDARLRNCMLTRFGQEISADPLGPKLDPFTQEVFGSYVEYWRTAFLGPEARTNAQTTLEAKLRAIVKADDKAGDFDALEEHLKRELTGRGYHVLLGQTGLLRELMLWRQQSSLTYRVPLPEGEQEARVEVLDGFVSLGWADYALCNYRGTGGWAKDGVLFAVRPRYVSLEVEEFRVTFLGHETQHAVDQREFPGLAAWQLEYRAKLVELALARETRAQVLRRFTEDQGDDPASPHSYANRRVLRDMCQSLDLPADADLNRQPMEAVQQAAVSLLRADGKRLRKK